MRAGDPLYWNGTHLADIKRVVVYENGDYHTIEPLGGAYLWPNGWLTVYPTANPNEGVMFPPNVIRSVHFGDE